MEIVDRHVPLSEIGKTVGPAPVPRFMANVRRNGVVIPILLREVVSADGTVEYRIVDGNRRVAAAREVGLRDITGRVLIGVSSEEAARLVLMANNFRSANEITEFWAIKHLERSGAPREHIADDAGIEIRYLRLRDRWSTLDRRLFSAYAAGKLPSSVVNKIVKMEPADQRHFGDLFERKGRVMTADLQARARRDRSTSQTSSGSSPASSPAVTPSPPSAADQTDDTGDRPVTIVTTGSGVGSGPDDLLWAIERAVQIGVREGVSLPELRRLLTVAYQQVAREEEPLKELASG